MYLRTFRICEIYNFNTAGFSIAPVLAWQVNGRKKIEAKYVTLLTDMRTLITNA